MSVYSKQMPLASDQALKLLKERRFSFYPAIRNVEHNEWTLERETWSEILAKNVESGREVWIPRSHLGEISSSDSPVLIVGLRRELEFKAGAVFPHHKSVVEMPAPRRARQAAREKPPRAPGKGRSSSTEAQNMRLIGRSLLIALSAVLLLILFAFEGVRNPIAALFLPDLSTADQRYLSLNRSDGYYDTIHKLGRPEREQWLGGEEDELQFQVLWYAKRSYTIVLMGASRSGVRYIGTLHDPARKVLDSARLSGGGDTSSMMRNLPEF